MHLIVLPATVLSLLQVSNETTVHVRRPGNPKKWRGKVLCEGKIADLALVTVEDDQFWTDELLDLQFVDVPELQASTPSHITIGSCHAWLHGVSACHMCTAAVFEWRWDYQVNMQCMQQAIVEQFAPLEQTN